MYLSEEFLDLVGEDYSKKNVWDATRVCDREIKERIESLKENSDYTEFFFRKEECFKPNNILAEVMDFWDVFKEHLYLFSWEEIHDIGLIRIIYEMKRHYKYCL